MISGNAKPAVGRLNPSDIILATDFSARCDRAQDRAVQLAIEWNATLTAVHPLSDMGLTNHPSLREAYRTGDAQRGSPAPGTSLHGRAPLVGGSGGGAV
ncbi:universal stress protein (plasmid) [Sinorhizobium fredii]|nr:hypothetical protein [Sinorhizobium fredii]UTY47366.1 universal stress protein [Sinorhizobium fredii]